MTEQEALLALNAVSGLGTVRINALLRHFGDAMGVMKAKGDDLRGAGLLPETVIQNLINFSKDKFLSDEYNLMHARNVTVITVADDIFPALLKEIPGCPLVLYVMGDPKVLSNISVGMVGSRNASYYGQKVSQDLACEFARASVGVISGLARGIDTFAHRGCLKGNFPTVGVVGCGFNYIYPRENADLYKAIIAAGGAVVSELPMGIAPAPGNFPPRNRIISGLSRAVVVVEAAAKSGALITVDYALEQGRDVFVVPGPIDNLGAAGSNRLIKDGAKVVLSVMDVLETLGVELAQQTMVTADGSIKVPLSMEEHRGYGMIDSQPMHIEQVATRSGWPLAQAREVMLNLELKQVVRQLPGQYYVKV